MSPCNSLDIGTWIEDINGIGCWYWYRVETTYRIRLEVNYTGGLTVTRPMRVINSFVCQSASIKCFKDISSTRIGISETIIKKFHIIPCDGSHCKCCEMVCLEDGVIDSTYRSDFGSGEITSIGTIFWIVNLHTCSYCQSWSRYINSSIGSSSRSIIKRYALIVGSDFGIFIGTEKFDIYCSCCGLRYIQYTCIIGTTLCFYKNSFWQFYLDICITCW